MRGRTFEFMVRAARAVLPEDMFLRAGALYRRWQGETPPAAVGLDSLVSLPPEGPGSGPSTRENDGMPDYPVTRPQLSFEYLSGLARWLADSDYRVITYRDTRSPHGGELEEFRQWIGRASAQGDKAILLHYDVDARPDVAMELLKLHIRLGLPANVMVFRHKIFDWKLKRDGVLERDPDYRLDPAVLRDFAAMGGVVGYHCNAFDRAAGDVARALEILEEDLVHMQAEYGVEFLSMHGGLVTPDGGCNARLPVEPLLAKYNVSWVHNGHSTYFHNTWSDGSASNPKYRGSCSDPADFIAATNPGERTRLLFHPQYYNDFSNTRFDFPVLADMRWTRRVQAEVESGGFSGPDYWRARSREIRENMDAYAPLFDMGRDEAPIFINGLSRSGTTLMCSIFDAHPDVAMGYESYPRYLRVPSDDGVLTPDRYLYACQTLINHRENTAFALLDAPAIRNLKRFAAVTSWTGMTTRETGELLRAYLAEKHVVADEAEALKIMAATIRFKVDAEGAAHWGTKCQGNFADYFALWPKARLVYILRDGLDILASQMTNGAFDPDPARLGRQWRDHRNQFLRFREQNPSVRTAEVRYEQLVSSPEPVVRELCRELDLEYHPRMIRQHEKETTLTRNPRGQLSADRVAQPMDTRSVGRWRSVLSREDADAFLDACGRDFHASLGYSEEDPCAA